MTLIRGSLRKLRRHGWAFPRLIEGPALERPPTLTFPEPDLFDYGAERILVVDDPLVVDLLVHNGVHTDARAIIVSTTGYPRDVAPHAAALMQHRPDIPVHVLHASHADPIELEMRTRGLLAAPDIRVTDVGLSPNAARTVKSLRWARRLPSVPVDALPHHLLTRGVVEAMAAGALLEALPSRDDGGVADFG